MYEIGSSGMKKISVGANDRKNNLPIGTVLQLNGYSNPKSVIIKADGIDGRFPDYGMRYQTINLESGSMQVRNAYELKWLSEKQDNRIQCYITNEVKTADEIMDAIKFVEVKKVERVREGQAKEQAKAAELDRILKEYSYLQKVEGSGKPGRVIGAVNIRAELKKVFPGVKFSVRSDSFSMGNSIDIGWTDGPTRQEVEAITDKYEYGTFDSMTDCSGYKDEQFTKVFGGAKFVQTQRRETKEVINNG